MPYVYSQQQQKFIVDRIKQVIFERGEGNPNYLVPERIYPTQTADPIFSQVDQQTYFLLYKRAAAEWILALEVGSFSRESIVLPVRYDTNNI